jgi:SAM-dependent methyltransferase
MTFDYRQSHLQKGEIYDANLDREPFSQYMAKCESRILQWLASEFFHNKIPHYLDFACGTGRITSFMEDFAEEAYGVDISRSMVAVAQCKCKKTRFSVLDITRETLNLPQMELITAFRFFGNAQDELRAGAFSSLREKLSPTGYLVFNNHCNPSAPINALPRIVGNTTTQLDLSRSKLRRLLRENGLRIVRIYGIGAWIFRHRIAADAQLLESRLASCLEPISLLPGIGWLCPDMVVVARRGPMS